MAIIYVNGKFIDDVTGQEVQGPGAPVEAPSVGKPAPPPQMAIPDVVPPAKSEPPPVDKPQQMSTPDAGGMTEEELDAQFAAGATTDVATGESTMENSPSAMDMETPERTSSGVGKVGDAGVGKAAGTGVGAMFGGPSGAAIGSTVGSVVDSGLQAIGGNKKSRLEKEQEKEAKYKAKQAKADYLEGKKTQLEADATEVVTAALMPLAFMQKMSS